MLFSYFYYHKLFLKIIYSRITLGGIKIIIGISAINYTIDNFTNARIPYTYINCLRNCGAYPFVIPTIDDDIYIEEVINRIDGLLIPGGGDVNPLLYHEEITPLSKDIDDLLDIFQIKLIKKALAKDMPILGICRGHQIINVALSGSLYQDLSLYKTNINVIHDQLKFGYQMKDKVHEVSFSGILERIYGKKVMTNSFHHQIIKTLGKDLEPIGYTKDGVIEAMISKIHKFVLTVQWHPERNDDYRPLFKLFIENCKR